MLGIIIPVSSGETRLADTLEYLKQRTVLPYKVVVCSLYEGEYEDICKVYNADLLITRTSIGDAKNLGAAHFYRDTDVLVFLDAHCKVDYSWDTEIIELLKDRSIGIATLHTYLLEPDFQIERRHQQGAGFSFNYDLKRIWVEANQNGEVDIINGAFQAFRKDTFWQLGGFIPFHDEDWGISLASKQFGYRNVCGNGQIGHVFKSGAINQPISYNPINDFAYGDLLIAYLYFPESEYNRMKKRHSPELVTYIEHNFEKLKEYIPTMPIDTYISRMKERCLFPRLEHGVLFPRLTSHSLTIRT